MAAPTIEIFRSEHTPGGFTYRDLDRLQRERAEVSRKTGQSFFLIAEVAPVVTLGRRESMDLYSKWDQPEIELLKISRGGLATYHGPGLWVVFWIRPVDAMTGVKPVVKTLLELASGVASDFGVSARVDLEDCVGLWSESGGKLASVGISVEDHVVQHGLCLNVVKTEPYGFDGINACGLQAETAWLTTQSYKRAMSQALDSIRTRIKQIA